MQESDLYQSWQYYSRTRQVLHTEGRKLRVLQAGRLNCARGPDYTSARFELDGVVYQGDVEFHIYPNDWYRHQHHLDRAYANVLLHLTACKSGSASLKIKHNLSANYIPTLVLPLPSKQVRLEHPARRCLPRSLFKKRLISNLQNLALQRFQLKIQQFRSALEYQSTAQAFYSNFLRALGYPHNSEPFQQLAERLDWVWLSGWIRKIWGNEQVLYALYAGHACFIPAHPKDDYSLQLQRAYQKYKVYLSTAQLDERLWQFALTRPANHPHFRLAAWVNLLYNKPSLPYPFLHKLFSERKSFPEVYKKIITYFTIPVDEYWKEHFAIDRQSAGCGRRVFFGKARITELLINIILPLFAAQARISGSEGFYDYLREMFLWLPAGVPYQFLIKNMSWFDECRQAWNKQAMYQALLHLDSNYCLLDGCQQCPLQRRLEGIDG